MFSIDEGNNCDCLPDVVNGDNRIGSLVKKDTVVHIVVINQH